MSRSSGQDQGQLTLAPSPSLALTPAFILILALTHEVSEPLTEGYFSIMNAVSYVMASITVTSK